MSPCATSCEVGCETGAESCNVSLYDLFPAIVRYRDALAQGSLEAEGTLEKITYMLEQETCITREQISDLATLLDADEADPDFLLYLSATLGTMVGFDATLGVPYQRWLTKNLIAVHKIKGTHLSWRQRFSHFFQSGALGFWYQVWELWKQIPYENSAWSRYQDYYRTLKSARYDLYYLDSEGEPVFLSPGEARDLLSYTDDVRPVHVLPRSLVTRVDLSDTFTAPTEDLDWTIENVSNVFSDQPDELTDQIAVDMQCGTSCETGSCEGYCELSCTAAACEFACQMGCTTGIETDPFPGLDPDFPGYPGYSCRSSCEGGSCEFGCQIGSCQSGCQSSSEVVKYPAHVEAACATGGCEGSCQSETEGEGCSLSCQSVSMLSDPPRLRIWYPYEGMEFPLDYSSDDWWITPPGSYEAAGFEKIGTGTFTDRTLVPALHPSKWVEVHCVKGDEVSEDHAFIGNGVNTFWNGSLDSIPHPGSVRIEAALTEDESVLTAGAAEGSKIVLVVDSTLFNVGDEVQVADDDHSEPNVIVSIVGASLIMRNALRTDYTVADSGYVRRIRKVLVAHTVEMLYPTDATAWLGELGGDVDEDAVLANRVVNHRDSLYWRVTFKEPPSIGAVITAHWVPETDCVYWLEQTFQGIDGTTLVVDSSSDLVATVVNTDKLVASASGETPGYLGAVVAGDHWIGVAASGAFVDWSHLGPKDAGHAWTHTVDPGGGKTYIKAYDDRGHFMGWWDSGGANWKGIDDPDGNELVEPTSTTALAIPAP